MRIDNKCDGHAGESMVTADVRRDLSLLGRITGSSFQTTWHYRGERFVGQEGWWALPPSVLHGEEPQNEQAESPESNWTFLKGKILKLFARNKLFFLNCVQTCCQADKGWGCYCSLAVVVIFVD